MKLIVGLGNPGKKYQNNRHNLGYMIIDYYLKEKGLEFNKSSKGGIFYKGIVKEEEVIIAKPINYMNNSGQFIRKMINFYKINPIDIFVIHDDKDIIEGKFKIKAQGSGAGHNGIKNIIDFLQSEYFPRLKCGIGKEKLPKKIRDYVLEDFSSLELKIINHSFPTYLNIIDDFIKNNFYYVANKYN